MISLSRIETPKKPIGGGRRRVAFSISCLAFAVLAICCVAQGIENPYYAVSPSQLYPSKYALLPLGTTYSDTVPNTLDLATRAEWFVKGAIQTITPSLHDAPAGALLRPESNFYDCSRGGQTANPCLINSSPNWGKVMRALTEARQMTGYDRDDADATFTTQHRMMNKMLNYDVTLDLLNKGYPSIVLPQRTITPTTVGMQALIAEWQRNPTPKLASAVNEFVRMHLDTRTSLVDSYGKTFGTVFAVDPNPSIETFQGYYGDYYIPFIQGKALRALSDCYIETGDATALAMSNELSDFLRNYEDHKLWRSPDPVRFPPEPGQFVGHIHSWLQTALGLATHAGALRKTNPTSQLAQVELSLANDVYNFVKRRTKAGRIGNFGESGSTGDMAILGIKLSEQGVASYYDEVESWTRNAMSEMQIDAQAAQYIDNNSRPLYEHTNVGTKVTGMFVGDGTHVASIPFNSAGFTSDYPANTFSGMYEVWNKTVEYKGSFAQVNFALNRASTYLDVKSDLPYRGRVEASMKSDIGPIQSIGVRVPEWADKNAVSVAERDAAGLERTLAASEWFWVSDRYVQVDGVQPEMSYVVSFPIEVYTETIYEMRDANRIWYEGSYPTASSPEFVIPYVGTFRGNTLVDITPRPTGGIPRYLRGDLASLPPVDVAPPTVQLTRFVPTEVSGLPGDYNNNGAVDAADYVVWREARQTGNLAADGNYDGMVSGPDYVVWRRNFGLTVGGAGMVVASVPEPATAGLVMIAIMTAATKSCRRPRSASAASSAAARKSCMSQRNCWTFGGFVSAFSFDSRRIQSAPFGTDYSHRA